ncbi:hypothetical protein BJV74DRAFT_41247 [Russula compacta]|nr:hypothetical protein BJV74DRAFT_41247 [Russula compacta]
MWARSPLQVNRSTSGPREPEMGTVIVADAESASPRISEPTVMNDSQMPSALESESLIPATRIYFTTSAEAKSSLLSVVTEALLHRLAGLDIDIRRESFNLCVMMSCIGPPINGARNDHNDDSQKNGIALARLLNRCHCVCSCFMLVGFVLVVTGWLDSGNYSSPMSRLAAVRFCAGSDQVLCCTHTCTVIDVSRIT